MHINLYRTLIGCSLLVLARWQKHKKCFYAQQRLAQQVSPVLLKAVRNRPEPSGTVRMPPGAVRTPVWVSREWNQCKTSTKLAMRCYVLQFIVV